jgi:glycosyltransferase involved in cell wall biosynthesis
MRHFADVDLIQKLSERDKVLSTHTQIPYRLLRSPRHDIVHALTPEMGIYSPIVSDKSVVTFHDLIPILAYREMSFRFSLVTAIYTRATWKIAARAKRIIANSTQTRNELVHILDVEPKKIRVVPLGLDARFRPRPRKASRELAIGFFGNYTYRKRVDVAISAFKLINQKVDAHLILAGGEIQTIYQRHFDMKKLIGGMKNVSLLGHISEDRLAELYNSFDVMLYPSMYEGFGLPILEAQRCGTPVLTLRGARIPEEVMKETVVCVDAPDMARRALEILTVSQKRAEISYSAAEYASRFTWERTIDETMNVYRELSR